MKGIVSFHAVDEQLMDDLVAPLIAGAKVNPEAYLDEALRHRRNGLHARRFPLALLETTGSAGPPEIERGSGVFRNIKTRLDRLEYRPDDVTQAVLDKFEPDMHLDGRPFFITEGSAERVAALVDEYFRAESEDAVEALALEQMVRLDREIARTVQPVAGPEVTPDFNYRRDLLEELKVLYDLPRAAREGATWRDTTTSGSRPASQAVEDSLALRAVAVHGRARPFWVARDVDGLETVCRAAGVAPPDQLVPAWRLLGAACEEFPGIRDHLGVELVRNESVGGFVASSDVPELLAFLNTHGTSIIREATRSGEGATATVLLRKIRECATYAELHGFGYLEAAGIVPPYMVPDEY